MFGVRLAVPLDWPPRKRMLANGAKSGHLSELWRPFYLLVGRARAPEVEWPL